MASGDDVQLPDLQVIQRYSLAVRGATAPVDEVIAALQSDLAWLTAGARRRTTPTPTRTATKPTSTKAVAKKAATAKKSAPAKRGGARKA